MALSPASKKRMNEQLEKRQKDESYVREIQSIQAKAKTAPFQRYCYNQQVELDTLRNDRDKKANAAFRSAKVHQTQDFAYQMNRMKTEEFRDQKYRQQLRENCPELRELERKLNAAYANKIVTAQIKEKEARRIKEQIIDRELTERLNRAHVPEKEYYKQEKEKELRLKEEYKKDLHDQMIYQENAKRSRYEDFLKEKKLIDELVQRIQEEEEREHQKKYCDMLKTQEDIRAFKENQQMWRAKAKLRLEREDMAIQEFIQHKMAMSKKSAEEKAEREAIKARICDDMAKKMYMEKRQQTEKEEILSELLEAEERESHERKHREKMEKELRARLDVHRALNTQMEERLENMKMDQERDARYKEELIAQIAENEKLDQLTQEKRRIKMLQLRRDIEETMKADRLKKAMDMQVKIKLDEIAREEAEKRRLLIEDERVRMITEHAENLIGFLPVGILTESEMSKLDDDLKMKLNCAEKNSL